MSRCLDTRRERLQYPVLDGILGEGLAPRKRDLTGNGRALWCGAYGRAARGRFLSRCALGEPALSCHDAGQRRKENVHARQDSPARTRLLPTTAETRGSTALGCGADADYPRRVAGIGADAACQRALYPWRRGGVPRRTP